MDDNNAKQLAANNGSITWEFRNLEDKELGYNHSEMFLLLHRANIQIKFMELRLAEQERKIRQLESRS